MPSEYYREVFGGEMSEACEFGSLDEANDILGLMMRHWNTLAGALFKDEVYGPVLLEDEDGMAHGNDWAFGFMRGMGMRHDGWAELVNDEEHGGCLIPMMMLCHEHDEDPEMRPKPISQRSAKKSSCTWRLGCWGRVATSGCTEKPTPAPHSHLSLGAMLPRSGGMILSVRLWEEVQALLRRGDRKLIRTPDSSNGRAPSARCDNCCARALVMKNRQGYKGYVIEARSCELKEQRILGEFRRGA